MPAVPAFPDFNDMFFQPVKPAALPAPASKQPADVNASLDKLFPDLLVNGTRGFLLTTTSSLARASGQANGYFSRLSQALAFERMMRSFMDFAAAVSPFPVAAAAPNFWSASMLPHPQQSPSWGFVSPAVQKAPNWQLPIGFPQPSFSGGQNAWADYAAFLVPATIFAAAPAFEAFWNFAA